MTFLIFKIMECVGVWDIAHYKPLSRVRDHRFKAEKHAGGYIRDHVTCL